MPDLKANIRVIPSAPGQSRPEVSRVKEAADRLSTLGFTVLRLGRFGVSVQAPEGHFENVLGFEKTPLLSATRDISPSDEHLAGLVDQVEMAPVPKLLE